jgi:hypothetical protein
LSLKNLRLYMLTNATIAGEGKLRAPEAGPDRRKDLDFVGIPRCTRVVAARVCPEELGTLLSVAGRAVGTALATKDSVARIATAHPDAVWTFKLHGRIVGGVALLMLNPEGMQALLRGDINLLDPPVRYVTDPAAPPAGIYVWAVVGPSVAAEGILRVLAKMKAPHYARSDFYAMPNTADGVRFTERMGFRPIPGLPHRLYRYVRCGNRSNQPEGVA